MATVHRNAARDQDVAQIRPSKRLGQRGTRFPVFDAVDLDDEKALSSTFDESRAPHARQFPRGALDGERVDRPQRIVNSRTATAHQPEPFAIVQIARIAGPVPHTSADPKPGVLVPEAIQVPREHVTPATTISRTLPGASEAAAKLAAANGPAGRPHDRR